MSQNLNDRIKLCRGVIISIGAFPLCWGNSGSKLSGRSLIVMGELKLVGVVLLRGSQIVEVVGVVVLSSCCRPIQLRTYLLTYLLIDLLTYLLSYLLNYVLYHLLTYLVT